MPTFNVEVEIVETFTRTRTTEVEVEVEDLNGVLDAVQGLDLDIVDEGEEGEGEGEEELVSTTRTATKIVLPRILSRAARVAGDESGFAVAEVQARPNGYVPYRVAHRPAV